MSRELTFIEHLLYTGSTPVPSETCLQAPQPPHGEGTLLSRGGVCPRSHSWEVVEAGEIVPSPAHISSCLPELNADPLAP